MPRSSSHLIGLVAQQLSVGVIYYLMGLCGYAMGGGVIGEQVYLIWPPSGVAIFALLSGGPRMVPAIMLPSMLLSLTDGTSALASSLIALGNLIGPMMAVLALKRAGFDQRFYRLRDYLLFAGVGCAVLGTVTACIGTAALVFSGETALAEARGTWINWWIGDFLGALLIGPTLISLFPFQRKRPSNPSPETGAEAPETDDRMSRLQTESGG